MNRWMRLSAALAWMLAALLIAACGDSDSGSGDEGGGEPIVLGFASAQTGAFNAFDGPFLNGAQLAVDDINSDGGVDGRQLEIITTDNKSDLSQVTPAALQALEKGADVVMTSCDYDYGAPAARAANEQGVLAVGCAGSPLYGAQGVGPLTFNTLQSSNVEAATMAQYGFDEQGWESAYLLKDTSLAYSRSNCDYFKESWEGLGGTVAGEDTFKNSDPSISAQVDRMQGVDADVIIVCSYVPGGPTAVKQIRGAGIETPIMGSVGFDITGALDSIPNLTDFYNPSNGLISEPDGNERHAELGKDYEAKFGEFPATEWGVIVGYSGVEMIAKAIEESGGSTMGEDLAASLGQFEDVDLMAGPTTYTDDCHIPVTRPYGIADYEDGERKFLVDSYDIDPEVVPEAPC